MKAERLAEKFVDAGFAEPGEIGRGDDAIHVQGRKRRMSDEALDFELSQARNADGGERPGDGEVFHFVEQRVGVAQMLC